MKSKDYNMKLNDLKSIWKPKIWKFKSYCVKIKIIKYKLVNCQSREKACSNMKGNLQSTKIDLSFWDSKLKD